MRPRRHIVNERANSYTTDFLVIRESQLQWDPQLPLGRQSRGAERARNEALHIRRPAREEAPTALDEVKRIGRPLLPVDGDDVRVSGEQHTAAIAGSYDGIEVRLAAAVITVQLRAHSAARQV